MEIRRAVLDDAIALGRVHAQSWRETYAGIVSDEWIATISDTERGAMWKHILGDPNPAKQWVAEVDGAIVGFAASGPSPDDPPVRPLHLWSLYVLRSHHRHGIGSTLMDVAIGDLPASLWVAEQNETARDFYARKGFVADGQTSTIDRMDSVAELRMVR